MSCGARCAPATIVGAVALGRTSLAQRWRAAVAALAALPTLVVLRDLAGDLELWRAVVGWALMYAVYLPLIWALSRSLRASDGAVLARGP